ncbi:type II toxin-antitoxin system HipA family toxin [Caenimonas koreensis DSM 17982]|uniref:Type II toxin-antitoxin system HipA family toxin n=1 Tax=Caenimonas koreensis DSM 17982 TaxID=1121255 RepID=A0A844AQ11_9BURK|nr:HipA domain-containing protein [Caenimonas koreensis]MRD46300.1 type II toxin-antitoxin system HipA family toxin [Caenimonas koreensis DSM 17982]
MATLNVWSGDELVGVLGHDSQANRFTFDYAREWLRADGRFPLSPLLPLERPASETPEQHSAQVRQFFENLLPEGEALDHAAQTAGTTRSNLVGLLIAIGRETAGALRVTLADDNPVQRAAVDTQRLREVTPEQLSRRIRERESLPFSVWDGKVRLSIAGYQDKIAVYESEGRWYLTEGGRLASTQIVKPLPMRKQLDTLPANEHLCMQLARRIGMEAADTRLVHVPEPVLLVRRFDRVETDAGVTRLHIVDGCQALGLAVSMKYERAYGDAAEVAHLRDGASLPKLFALLDQSPLPAVDRLRLLRWVIFQVLIGNTDAHGKNVSFFCDARGLRLAPAYDLVCMEALDAGFSHTYAMAIGDAFSEDELKPYEWAHFAHLCKLPFRLVAHELESLCGQVSAVMDGFLSDMIGQHVPEAVAHRFKEVVLAICARQREHVRQIARFKRTDFE